MLYYIPETPCEEIYDHNGNIIKPEDRIADSDMQFLASQLWDFTETYMNYVYMQDNPKFHLIISHLREIAKIIKDRKYDEIIDPLLIKDDRQQPRMIPVSESMYAAFPSDDNLPF